MYFLLEDGRKRGTTVVLNNLHDVGLFKKVLLQFIDIVYSHTTGLIDLPLKKRFVEHYLLTKENIYRCIKSYPSKKHSSVKCLITGRETYVPKISDLASRAFAEEQAKKMLSDIIKHQVTRHDVLETLMCDFVLSKNTPSEIYHTNRLESGL